VRECTKKCLSKVKGCEDRLCRYWIDYDDELNCAFISIMLNEQLSLKQIGQRIGVSTARVKQILDKTLKKIKISSEFDVLGN